MPEWGRNVAEGDKFETVTIQMKAFFIILLPVDLIWQFHKTLAG